MLHPKKSSLISTVSQANPQYFCLLAALALEFALMAFGGYGLYFIDNYVIVPCMAFLGTVMVRKIQPNVRWQLWLGLIAAAWFAVTQMLHFAMDLEVRNHGLFFSIYLMAFPFAGFAEDGKKQIGLKLAGLVYIAAALVLVGFTGLLLADALPGFLRPHVFWDGARLQAMWHPNICASIFMIGIAFCLGFSTIGTKKWHRVLSIGVAVLLFATMALTNSRTSILMTCAIIGGFVFFWIFQKRDWKRFLAGALAAVIVIVGLFLGAGAIFDAHTSRLVAQVAAEMPAESASSSVSAEVVVNQRTGETGLKTDAVQGDLASDLKTLNGRTSIWKAAIRAMKDNPSILVFGTDYNDEIISMYMNHNVAHAHNSWMEILMGLGIPGLLIALVFTAIAVWSIARTLLSGKTCLWHKTIALLLLCLLGAAILEPYLFLSDRYYHYTDFIFFLGLGYTTQPERKAQ